MEIYDCIIVGGGPAGLNAAVVLGRSLRKVLVFDTGEQRNRSSHGMHNFLTRDGILPTDFIEEAHKEIAKYKVELKTMKIIKALKNKNDLFEVKDELNKIYLTKKLLIATGLKDTLPDINGINELYGKSVFHCPYCDGWEVAGKKIGVYAKNKNGFDLALALKTWSNTVSLFTDGKRSVKPSQHNILEANQIPVITSPILRLEGNKGQLKKVVFRDGNDQVLDALFFVNGYTQQCNLAETFGCEVSKKVVVLTNKFQQTKVKGLFVAGDADKDMHFVVIAAAEGAKAGVVINKELISESIKS
jgi:thioredoxin reductase